MVKNVDYVEQLVVNYLLVVEVVQQCGDEVWVNQYLECVIELVGDDLILVEIICVCLQLVCNENYVVCYGIDKLLEIILCYLEVLCFVEQVYICIGVWQLLLDIILLMVKVNVGDEVYCVVLEQLVWVGLMDKVLVDGGSEGLCEWWCNQSCKMWVLVLLQVVMVECFIESDDYDIVQ